MNSFVLSAALVFMSISASATGSDPMLSDLKSLVEINSGSSNGPGVNQIQNWIEARLKKLGFEITMNKNPLGEDHSGNLLVGTLRGRNPSFITIIVHADTVFELSSPFQKLKLSDDGSKAFGPGVIDDKGGVLIALKGLQDYLDKNQAGHSIRFVSSPNEEAGTAGFNKSIQEFAKDSFLVLGFEPALDDGSIVNSRRGNRWYHIKVTGKEAHAGRAHAEGINACLDLATKLVEISKLTDYAKDVTVSVGRMSGGQDKFNIVCGSAEAKVDTRFATLEDRNKLAKKIEAILNHPLVHSHKTNEGTKTEIQIEDDAPPYSMTQESKPMVNRYLDAIEKSEKVRPSAEKSGGTADTNYLSQKGLIIFDGLGPVGGKMHTVEEYIILESLKTRANALTDFLHSLDK